VPVLGPDLVDIRQIDLIKQEAARYAEQAAAETAVS
jgi:hypothetical protein